MAEGGQKAELKVDRSEEQTRSGIERWNGEWAAVAEKMTDEINLAAENGQRGAQRAIRIAGGAPMRSS